MTLREKQVLFAGLVARLLERAGELGYEATFGEAWRSDEQAVINAFGDAGRSGSRRATRAALCHRGSSRRRNSRYAASRSAASSPPAAP